MVAMRRSSGLHANEQPLTVLHWDIAGSCALLSSLPLRTYCEVVRTCQEAAAEAIEDHGGTVARYMGDALLAYFGFPVRRDDDCGRAVRAAFDLPLTWLHRGIIVRSRAAIASGPVIVGAALGSQAAREFPAFGQAPSLAARLLAVTPEAGVVVDDATRFALDGSFAVEAMEGLSLKGLPHVRRAWRMLRQPAAGRAIGAAEAVRC
jgi:class 3 adenylate cyclase